MIAHDPEQTSKRAEALPNGFPWTSADMLRRSLCAQRSPSTPSRAASGDQRISMPLFGQIQRTTSPLEMSALAWMVRTPKIVSAL